MSSTRKAENGSPLRQERYASDPAFNDHLIASRVAPKCGLFTNPAHKELCLHLQYVSMQPGGLTSFVEDFLKRYGDRAGSKTMRQNSGKETYGSVLVRQIRDELNLCPDRFPLKDEWTCSLWEGPELGEYETRHEYEERLENWRTEKTAAAARHPETYPAQAFFDRCRDLAEENLESWLVGFCLNPKTTFSSPPGWFHDLEKSLLDYIEDRRADDRAGMVVTSIGEQINDALDYAWEEKVMVHINGVARMGKTYQLQNWCAAYPGRVRYVQVPSGNDDISFFRAIARALGTAAGSTSKTTQIKNCIEGAIQDTGIMLVFDEAHYLFPQYKDCRSSPRRINWLLTQVVNKGIPAAIVSTPQFDVTQKAVVSGTGWASEQLDGRIAFRLDLPAVLPQEDLTAIARHYLPDAPKELLEFLCAYARRSGKFLAGLEAVSKRARYLARKAGRASPNGAEVEAAMAQVDPAIAPIFNQKEDPQGECKPPAKPKQRACRPAARTVNPVEKQLVPAG